VIRPWSKAQPLTELPAWRRLLFCLGALLLGTQVVIFGGWPRSELTHKAGAPHLDFEMWDNAKHPCILLNNTLIISTTARGRCAR